MSRWMTPQSWLTVAVVGGCVMVYWFAVHRPSHRMATTIQAEIHTLNDAVSRLPAEVDRIVTQEEALAASILQITELRSRFLIHATVSPVLAGITRMADEADVALVRIEPRDPVAHEAYATHQFDVLFQGPFNNVATMLRNLEASQPAIHVRKAVLTPGPKSGGFGEDEVHVSCEAALSVPVFSPDSDDHADFHAASRRTTTDIR